MVGKWSKVVKMGQKLMKIGQKFFVQTWLKLVEIL
jgi:hypothetical protein